jgi:hypothetical protein
VIFTLAFRHLLVRKRRSLFLLFGFSLGVGVMIVLLSVGEAMLAQSRDVSLVGGGELTILPQGIDIEAMRTGGLSGMFFGIDRARFLTREVLGGDRFKSRVRVVSPFIEGKLVYLRHGKRVIAVRAGGEIPSRAAAVGSRLDVRAGRWDDSPADSSYMSPTRQQFYDELDRFHLPTRPDPTWGEWHYFNLVISPEEWWYITFLVGGEVRSGNWGGQLLITRRSRGSRYDRFTAEVPASSVTFDTARADLTLARSAVRQRNGSYQIHAEATGNAGRVRLDFKLLPEANRYFPPVELREASFVSGYVVPALSGSASGKVCISGKCRDFAGVQAYHDHNWGVWRDVGWEWGSGTGRRLNLLYGGVYDSSSTSSDNSRPSAPFFFALVDSLGVKQVLRFYRVHYEGKQRAAGVLGVTAPKNFTLIAARDDDTVRLSVQVEDALSSEMAARQFRRIFLQMRGRFTLAGRVMGEEVADTGMGFFETYIDK